MTTPSKRHLEEATDIICDFNVNDAEIILRYKKPKKKVRSLATMFATALAQAEARQREKDAEIAEKAAPHTHLELSISHQVARAIRQQRENDEVT